MKNLLIITFDLIRKGEPQTSLSVGYLLSYLKNNENYKKKFLVNHISFNLHDDPEISVDTVLNRIAKEYDFTLLDYLAIGCYIWSEHLINPLLKAIRENRFRNKFILGGYQISNSKDLESKYPDCHFYIVGNGEAALLEAILLDEPDYPIVKYKPPNVYSLPSPYLSDDIEIIDDQEKVRIETKRGCPYNCSFCAHKDLQNNNIYYHDETIIYEELKLLKNKNVKKINIIDPSFNVGRNYTKILKMMVDLGIKSKISIQVRLKNIPANKDNDFIRYSSLLNMNFEFGIQSIHDKELQVLNRANDIRYIDNVLAQLTDSNIIYEFTLLYGIPYQTVKSFKESINFLISRGCTKIKAFPLNLLRGTKLWEQRRFWDFKEKGIGRHNIPSVISCKTFHYEEWLEMKQLAKTLSKVTGE